jgi:pimeloyl-ACP methyl ester carboxylesterase
VQRRLTTDGVIEMPNAYDEQPYQITMGLIEDGRDHMLLGKAIALDCPVRLVHGMKDEDVPWQTALEISERLSATDVAITLVKDGGHRLSEPADLDRLCQVLGSLIDG